MPANFNLDFPCAYGAPPVTAQLKVAPEDFYVEEKLGFEPCGAGEHLYLFVEKRNQNTQFVAEYIAKMARVQLSDVSYSGMKDRRAVTRQWFSVYLQQRDDFVWQSLPDCEMTLLISTRHNKKLRRGEHAANLFRICLRNVMGDLVALDERLKCIAENGAPNYFGEQRFGNQGSNLQDIERFLSRSKGKQQGFQDRLKVSAMRSWLFNQVLAERVGNGTWNRCVEGDPQAEPSASLWGRGRLASSGQVREWEEKVMKEYPQWCHFLEHCGLQQERRPLMLNPQCFVHRLDQDTLELEFLLPAGGYATTLLREVAGNQCNERGIVGFSHNA